MKLKIIIIIIIIIIVLACINFDAPYLVFNLLIDAI